MRIERKALFFMLGLLVSVAVPASAGPMRLKVGAAKNAGVVQFALHHAVTGESHVVEAYVASALDAAPKAQAVADAVAATDASGTWRAVASGAELTFEHQVGLIWLAVDTVTDLVDTTGAGSKLSTSGNVVDFTLDIDPEATATGVDAVDSPSFITVSLTDTLAWTRPIQVGQSASNLLDQFESFLRSEAGEGILVVRESPNQLQVTLLYDSSPMNWEITDTGLQPLAKGGGYSTDWPAGLIDRGRK
jgi:hypothetical protein